MQTSLRYNPEKIYHKSNINPEIHYKSTIRRAFGHGVLDCALASFFGYFGYIRGTPQNPRRDGEGRGGCKIELSPRRREKEGHFIV